MTHEYGDAPVDKEYIAKMTAIMETLDDFVNPGQRAPNKEVAIVVMMFPYNDGPGRCNYMSNGVSRRDMVTLMKEQIARFEGMPELKGNA